MQVNEFIPDQQHHIKKKNSNRTHESDKDALP